MKCVLTYNKADGSLTTVSMGTDNSTKPILATLLTNIALSSANYSVSDDCLGVRVNNKIFHWNNTAYILKNVIHPTTNITTIPNPVFSADFNLMVTDYGVYYYSSTTTNYSSDKTENFSPSKTIFRNGNNLIIVSRTDQIPYYNNYNMTVQLRIISGASSAIFKQMKFIFSSNQISTVSVSDKLTNLVLNGISSDGISRFVVVKSIDWVFQTVNDINLPQLTKISPNQFVVSQDYLYVRNLVGSLKKHYAYSISCSGLVEQFNEIIPIQTSDYVKTFILPDTSSTGKLVLAHQFNGNNNWRRIVQDIRSKVYIPSYGEVRFTYDPTAGSATSTIIGKSSQNFQYLYQRNFSGASYSYEFVKYDTTSKNNIKVVSFGSTVPLTVKAYSKDLTCAALYDATSTTKKLYIVRFVYNDNYTEQIIRSGLITEADANSASFEVSSNCQALKINLKVYHYDPTTNLPSKYIADNVASLVSPVFSNDFKHIAANDGIYAYSASNRTYTNVRTAVFNASKTILTTQNGIIVLTWVSIANGSAIKNYTLQAFSISQNYNSMSNISGRFFEENTNNGPNLTVSSNLKRVIVYGVTTDSVNYAKGQYTSTYYFATGKFISYNSYERSNNLNDMALPSWLSSSANTTVSVSDNYIYARNNDSHVAYFSTGNQLYTYFNAVPLTASETTSYTFRNMVQNVDSNELSVLRQHNSSNIVTLKRQIYTANSQILRFDTTYNSTLSCISTFDSYYKPGWISQGALNATTTNKIYGAILNDTNNEKIFGSTITLNQNTWIIATSQNVRCMLIFDKVNQTLSTISTQDYLIKTVSGSVSSGLTLSTANYSVSDDCLALRINDKIFHYNGSGYAADNVTHPTGVTVTTITNPKFSADFSVMVTDNAVYYYTSGKYTSDKAEKFDPIKYVLRNGSNLMIINYGKPVNFYNVNVQFRNMSTTGINSSSVFSQFYAQFNDTQVPRYTVSQRLTNFILYGLGAEGTSRITIAKSVDWPNNWVNDIILPQPAVRSKNEFVVTENYLYIRNLDGSNKKHYAYSVYSTTIVEQFNQTIPIQQSDYKRTFILADNTGAGNLVLAHAFNGNGNWIRLIKDTRSLVLAPEYINTDAQYYRKVAIIVGVVIPVSLLIIFAVIFLLSKSSGSLFNSSPKVQQDKDIDRRQVESQKQIESNQYRP